MYNVLTAKKKTRDNATKAKGKEKRVVLNLKEFIFSKHNINNVLH